MTVKKSKKVTGVANIQAKNIIKLAAHFVINIKKVAPVHILS